MKKQNWRSDLARDLIAFSAISPSKLTMCLDSLHKSCRKKPAQNKPATFFGSKKKQRLGRWSMGPEAIGTDQSTFCGVLAESRKSTRGG